jgi:hypothetical protein
MTEPREGAGGDAWLRHATEKSCPSEILPTHCVNYNLTGSQW